MYKRILLVIIFLCASFFLLWGKDAREKGAVEKETGDTELAVSTKTVPEAGSYVIDSVDYRIDGNTREKVLVHYLDIEKGMSFSSKEELILFIKDKEQLIENQRTLAEGRIESSFSRDPGQSDRIFVDLDVYAEDTWNFVALPYAKYDSNEGALLSLRGRNYNFLGGMEALAVDIDYLRTVEDENEFAVVTEGAIPFYWWGYEWKFEFKEDVAYVPDQPLRSYSKGELSVDIPSRFYTWQMEIGQEYFLNEDYEKGDPDPDGYYLKTSGRFGTSIPTGIEVPPLGEFDYTPGIISSVSYKFGNSLSEERKGYDLGFDHSLEAGRIDWHGNFREGAELSLSHTHKYNFTREIWLADVDFTFEGHTAFERVGISSRLKGFYSFNSVRKDKGDALRGILNKRIVGEAGVMFNVAVPFDMWMWFLSDWFDGHISPFFDYGLTKPEGGDFSKSWYGGGIEILGFPTFARSIYARLSFGLDLKALSKGYKLSDTIDTGDGRAPIYEIYLGLGHHY